jgi:hypothetical protein
MMMCDKDAVEREGLLFDHLNHRGGIARIYNAEGLGIIAEKAPNVVVVKCG